MERDPAHHTPHQDAITMRRRVLTQVIAREGGAYILPEQNRQPDPALRVASIRARGLMGIGATEAQAQADWFRQAVATSAAQVPQARVMRMAAE